MKENKMFKKFNPYHYNVCDPQLERISRMVCETWEDQMMEFEKEWWDTKIKEPKKRKGKKGKKGEHNKAC